jgi:tetratricopeptide (TPR) repeat protein
LIQAADIALAEGDLKTAKANLAHLEASGSDTDELKLLRANLYAAEGKVTEAMAELEKISAKSIAAETLRSRIAAVTATNAAELESRLAAAPNDPAVLGRLCTLYRREQPQKALTYCRRAAEAQPDNVNHVVGYAAALVQARQFEAAASILRKVVEKIPDNSVAHANLATALFQLKLYPDARAEFLWLSRDQPESAGPYLFLGIISDELGEYSDALAYYRKYVGIADPLTNKTDIEKVNLRIPALVKLVKEGKNGKSGHR